MELTLESAFSTGGMVGHLSYLLLVISMLMRRMTLLRLLVIASSLVAITYDVVWLKDPVGVFWETLLVTVNVVQIALIWHADRRARFTEDERGLVDSRLRSLAPHQARQLLDMGFWAEGAPGLELTQEGQPVSHLVYLVAGDVGIEAGGHRVGQCGPGNFVGEMSLVDGSDATATAVIDSPARYWMIATDRLRALRTDKPELAQALELGIAHDLKAKVLRANARP